MKDLAMAYAMKKRMKKPEMMAHGGMAREEEESGMEPMPKVHMPAEDEDEDMVGRIMKHRMYSKGGMVANGGEDDLDDMADGKPNEFDDLALRDDLEFSYTGKNSGDELGRDHMDDEEGDRVARIMRARKR